MNYKTEKPRDVTDRVITLWKALSPEARQDEATMSRIVHEAIYDAWELGISYGKERVAARFASLLCDGDC